MPSSVAIALDWDSWWAIEQPASPTTVPYLEVLFAWHRALTSLGVAVDFVRAQADLSGYRVVVAPAHFVMTDEQAANLAGFAEAGGTLVVGFGSAITDEHLRVRLGGYLGEPLRAALGVWIEEFAPPAAPDLRAVGGGIAPPVGLQGDPVGEDATGSVWAEVVRVDDADTLVRFRDGALDGLPAVTRRAHGRRQRLVRRHPARARCAAAARRTECWRYAGVEGVPPAAANGADVEVVRRGDVVFVINHGAEDAEVLVDGADLFTGHPSRGSVLPSQGVAIIGGARQARLTGGRARVVTTRARPRAPAPQAPVGRRRERQEHRGDHQRPDGCRDHGVLGEPSARHAGRIAEQFARAVAVAGTGFHSAIVPSHAGMVSADTNTVERKPIGQTSTCTAVVAPGPRKRRPRKIPSRAGRTGPEQQHDGEGDLGGAGGGRQPMRSPPTMSTARPTADSPGRRARARGPPRRWRSAAIGSGR